jgi:hypothetical protein
MSNNNNYLINNNKLQLQSNRIKQIYFDEITGKLVILDSNENSYQCDIYGDKKPQFLPYVSGYANYTERKEKGLELNLKTKFNDTMYRPQTSKIKSFKVFKKFFVAFLFRKI